MRAVRQSLSALSDNNCFLGEYGEVQEALKESPLRQFAREACDTTGYTPDVTEIFKSKYQLLFVNDTLQRFLPDHELLEDGEFCGQAYTVDDNFTMFRKKDKDPFPIPLLTPFSSTRGQLMGELFLIKTETLVKIDEFKSNTAYFNRLKMPVVVPWRLLSDNNKITPKHIMQKKDAWVYVASSLAFKESIEYGEDKYAFCDVYTSAVSPRHYVFTSMDLEV